MADHIRDNYSLFSKFSHMSLALNISKTTCAEGKEGKETETLDNLSCRNLKDL